MKALSLCNSPQVLQITRYTALNSAAINYRYLDLIQTRGLIYLVYENHVGYNLKEILLYAYFGSIVNNRFNKTVYLLIRYLYR